MGLVMLGGIFLVAVTGYRLAGWSWLDSAYMVVTTMTTVGYREMGEMTPRLQIFTMLVIVFGVSTTLYIMGGFVQMVLEGEVNRALGIRRVTREIERLSGHVIVCGFGRMGEIIARELTARGRNLVVLETNSEQAALAAAQGYLAVTADATEEDALLHAGVVRAQTLVTTLPSDADNVFITLTARNLNTSLQIIARGELRTTEKKLIQAGANRVVLPAATGATRMVTMITRPTVVELVELAAGGIFEEMAIDELNLPAGNELVGKTVRDSEARNHYGLLIVAIRHAEGARLFNPGAGTVFQSGDSVIVMGKVDDIERFRDDYGICQEVPGQRSPDDDPAEGRA
jgi:voltage-gated potassium channel